MFCEFEHCSGILFAVGIYIIMFSYRHWTMLLRLWIGWENMWWWFNWHGRTGAVGTQENGRSQMMEKQKMDGNGPRAREKGNITATGDGMRKWTCQENGTDEHGRSSGAGGKMATHWDVEEWECGWLERGHGWAALEEWGPENCVSRPHWGDLRGLARWNCGTSGWLEKDQWRDPVDITHEEISEALLLGGPELWRHWTDTLAGGHWKAWVHCRKAAIE